MLEGSLANAVDAVLFQNILTKFRLNPDSTTLFSSSFFLFLSYLFMKLTIVQRITFMIKILQRMMFTIASVKRMTFTIIQSYNLLCL